MERSGYYDITRYTYLVDRKLTIIAFLFWFFLLFSKQVYNPSNLILSVINVILHSPY